MNDDEILALWEQGKLHYGDSKDPRSPVQPWIRRKLKEMGWSQNQLAQRMTEVSGIKTHPSAIGNIMTRTSRMGVELASRIARAIDIPETVLFSLGGLQKHASLHNDIDKAEIELLYDNLDAYHRKMLKEYGKYLRELQSRLDTDDKAPRTRPRRILDDNRRTKRNKPKGDS